MRVLVLSALFLSFIAVLMKPAAAVEGRFQVDGLDLALRLDDGRVFRGQTLTGMTLVLGTPSGDAEIRIDGVAHEEEIRGRPATFFRMSVKDRDGSSKDLCQPDPDGARMAFAYPNGAGGFSLTCTSGAEGKCILFGYRPWETREGMPMRDLHQACIHLLRADYGGDDRPSTRNGTLINLYDRFGIQDPGQAAGMTFEAAWGPEGAVCVAHPRIPDTVTLDQLAERYPRLKGRLGPDACTESAMRADPRALIFNQSAVIGPPANR